MEFHVSFESLELFHSCGVIFLIYIFAARSFPTLFRPKRTLKEVARPQDHTDLGHPQGKQEYCWASRRLFVGLSSLLFATCFAEGLFTMLATFRIPGKQRDAFLIIIPKLSTSALYATELTFLFHNNSHPTIAHLCCWLLAMPIEIATYKVSVSTELDVLTGDGSWLPRFIKSGTTSLALETTRIITLCLLILLYTISYPSRNNRREASGAVHLTDLHGSSMNAEPSQHHEQSMQAKCVEVVTSEEEFEDTTRILSDGRWNYFKSYRALLPYMWPSQSRHLQLVACVCFALTAFQRVVNILIPSQTEVMFARLLDGSNSPWRDIIRYIIYIWLQGEGGLLKSLSSILWDHVKCHCSRQLSIATFEHVHNLSLDFHLGKRNAELLSAMKDGEGITGFLELVTFRIIPTFCDFGIAMGCFWVYIDVYTTLMLCVLIFGYIGLSAARAKGEGELQKRTAAAYQEEYWVKNASVDLYETVKYFNAEKYETERYYNAVGKRQMAEYRYLLYRVLSGTSKLAFFMVSFLAISLMTGYRVSQGHLSLGQFMSLITYMLQLRSSLDSVTGVSHSFQTLLIHSEKTLRLLQQQPTVVDGPQAVPLTTCRGEIRFEKATFSYGGKKNALNGVSFHCSAGTTTALVGETGAGKSTVLRLLYRFFNLQEGCIFIDGDSVHNISIDSLRRQIAVVSQDVVLFNDTLMYNLKYANPDVRDEDVYEACRAAGIHDTIMGFSDGYATEVGERGLALSGGERQRVTIARAILKDTKIILLDEATASLDTNTEEHVQNSLASLAHGRTTIVVAHRLSTVTDAECILVFHKGEVVEQGTHQELIKLKGRYASMWRKQTREHKNVQTKEEHEEETEEETEEKTDEAIEERKARSWFRGNTVRKKLQRFITISHVFQFRRK